MSFHIEPKSRFFQVLCRLPEKEIRADVAVMFHSLVDLTEIESLRKQAGARGETKPSYTAFVVRALGQTLAEFPYANRRVVRQPWRLLRGPRLQRFDHCDVAVAVERHLPGEEAVAFVDVLRRADEKSLADTNQWLRELAASDETNNEQWRNFAQLMRKYPPSLAALMVRLPVWFPSLWVKFRGAAALVTSPAKYGVDGVVATWAWPLGVTFGLVKQRPLVRDGQIVAAPTFTLGVNFDRRVMAGAQAAMFFARLVERLEKAASHLNALPQDRDAKAKQKSPDVAASHGGGPDG